MNAAASHLTATELWESVFTPYRARILYPISLVGATVFVPLAVMHFAQGHLGLGSVLVCLVAMMAADAIALHRGKAPPIPFACLLLPGFAGVAMSLTTQGMYGALWSYPLVFLSFFVLRRPIANSVGLALVVAGTILIALIEEPGMAARYFMSVVFCLVVINIMLNVLESLHTRLLEQSLTDPLTGAFNRRHMDAHLESVLERHRRTGAPSSALLVDIDHFKRINDRLGHQKGDEVLKAVVAIIDERRRKLDLLFRQGGEEFLLLLPDTRKPEAMAVAESLRESIEKARIAGEQITVSIGVGEVSREDGAADWMKRLDDALYQAKEGGRNRIMGDVLRAVPSRAIVASRRMSA
jgi:diguanylate cyclase (GGDEF)-like protein